VAEYAAGAGASVTGASRKAAPAGFQGSWKTCDLLDVNQVTSAIAEQDVVVHCASNVQNPQDDANVLDNLVTASRAVENIHLVYVSICGIENSANYSSYYKVKVRNEVVLRQSGRPHTIARISQFHPFAAMILSRLVIGPFLLVPKVTFQSVDLDFAAQQLALISLQVPQGRAPDIHGPESLSLFKMAKSWLRAREKSKLVIPVPALGPMRGFGKLISVQGLTGGPSWEEWLAAHRSSDNPYGEK
jgi:uncharacterized protein YbjT (DUF2867 family)